MTTESTTGKAIELETGGEMFVPPAEDALHIAICQAVQADRYKASDILRQALLDYQPTHLTRTELIRVQQRSGGEQVTAVMVSPVGTSPIDMLLFCPVCWEQHIDQPEDEQRYRHRLEVYGLHAEPFDRVPVRWMNPPHRSHQCHKCNAVWRPADVPTNGVAKISTKGQKDTWIPCVSTPADAEQPGRLRDAGRDALRFMQWQADPTAETYPSDLPQGYDVIAALRNALGKEGD